MRSHHQRGNVLFLILLGVVLFAALSYAVTQGFGGGNSALSKTSLKAYANDIILTAASYEKGVQKLLNKGVSENDISFSLVSGDAYEHSSPQPAENKVFSITGGGVNYLDPLKDILDSNAVGLKWYGQWGFSGINRIIGIGDDSHRTEIMVFLPYVKRDICLEVNEIENIPTVSGEPPADSGAAGFFEFKGTVSGSTSIRDSDAYLDGHKFGCFKADAYNPGTVDISDKYVFFYVLHAR